LYLTVVLEMTTTEYIEVLTMYEEDSDSEVYCWLRLEEPERLLERLALFIIGAPDAARKEVELGRDDNPEVLGAVVRENLEFDDADDELGILNLELFVVLGRNTLLEAVKDVLVKFAVVFRRHDAGMVKQQRRLTVMTELGANTPLNLCWYILLPSLF
jgi:hypothetical protein